MFTSNINTYFGILSSEEDNFILARSLQFGDASDNINYITHISWISISRTSHVRLSVSPFIATQTSLSVLKLPWWNLVHILLIDSIAWIVRNDPDRNDATYSYKAYKISNKISVMTLHPNLIHLISSKSQHYIYKYLSKEKSPEIRLFV